MFDTLLIANRGEIACRIMATAHRMGIRTVAVYSDADSHAQHVQQADVAVRIGPPPARESYLNIIAVLDAAVATGAEAVHPGYGFLSENAEFAAACQERGLVFVGPSAEAIRAMGSKIEAKRLVSAAGTPVVPGYEGDDQSEDMLLSAATEIGYPLLIKASAGGGGKGMRLVAGPDEFNKALAGARREAMAAFADDRVLLERYLAAPKHLEVQILADARGNTLHLHERDCSVQRRHQKVIEEAPGPTVDDALREQLGAAAVNAARAINYLGAGTVEFIAEGGEFFFMEMNTRLQVEHPVTEAITGLDLVEWQLRIAAGEPLTLTQDSVPRRGHAIEARVYAENPRNRFLPSTGELRYLSFPREVRVDSGFVTGDRVSVHYDPMLAKLIAHGPDRAAAIAQLDGALRHTRIAGIEHNVAYLRRVLDHPEFRAGDYTTGIAERHADVLIVEPEPSLAVCAALAAQRSVSGDEPWTRSDGFRLNAESRFELRLKRGKTVLHLALGDGWASLGEARHSVSDVKFVDGALECRIDGERVAAQVLIGADSVFVMSGGDTVRFDWLVDDPGAFAGDAAAADRVTSPMPGQVIAVSVKVGDSVQAGQLLLVVEAMKMEHSITAPRAGVVAAVNCAPGDRVEDGVELIQFG